MDSLLLYQFVKTLHILSAVIIAGTGFGTAFYLFVVNRSGSLPAQSVVSYWVCKADFWFTTPCVIFQPISGVWLMSKLGIPWSATWIWVSIGLYLLGQYWTVFICWYVVAACGMVANPNEKHRQTRLRHKQYTPPKLLAIRQKMGVGRLSCVFGGCGDILFDGH